MPPYGLVDRDYTRRLRSAAADGRIYMLALTQFRRGSRGAAGRDSCVVEEADTAYAPIPLLAAAGASVCFAADVVASSGDWDQVAVIGYPTRRSFVELAYQPAFMEWHRSKDAHIARTTVLGTLPASSLPGPASSGRILLEAWDGPVPQPVADGHVSVFDVEGTVIGDGRQWSGLRYTAIEPGTTLPLQDATPGYQALLLAPTVERWR